VLSSEWCRCKETAELLGLEKWTPFSGLNSFFQDFANKQVVLEKLDQKLRKLEPGVTLMVTHQVVITSVTGQAVGSGEFIAFNTRTKEARKFRLD
jgi:broad specificity phosphatase PhoE